MNKECAEEEKEIASTSGIINKHNNGRTDKIEEDWINKGRFLRTLARKTLHNQRKMQ